MQVSLFVILLTLRFYITDRCFTKQEKQRDSYYVNNRNHGLCPAWHMGETLKYTEIKGEIYMGNMLHEIESYWSGRAEGYSKVNQDELQGEQKEKWMQVLHEKFPDREPGSISVLDIGTGPGFFAVILAEQGYRVTAVDYTPEMLEQARKNAGIYAGRINWYQMDAQKLDFPSGQFDVVVSRNLTWNLESPEKAYQEWHRVLKKDGIMLNFDANWYAHLFNQELRAAYEKDREQVEQMALEDHYTCTNIDWMEEIARKMPLSPVARPAWDCQVLKHIGFGKVIAEENIGDRVWSLTEKMNYASTPMFCVAAYR